MHEASDGAATHARIGVAPPEHWHGRRRLFDALEAAYPVRFEPRNPGDRLNLDAIVAIGREKAVAHGPGIPVLTATGSERRQEQPAVVEVADEPSIHRALRGASLTDGWTAPLAPGDRGKPPGESLLASVGGLPAWMIDGTGGAIVSAIPDELGDGEALRNRLAPGRCLALMALVEFLRQLTAPEGWEPPAPRAAFVIDDPNLHWPTYGHVRYGELARHAAEHGYHVAIAMVPLDSWLVHPGVARTFRDHSPQLSICVHGNDHDGPELGRIDSEPAGILIVGQALQRVAAFERRTGVVVDRVMVPPHEKLSEPAARALRACGYEAVSASRPYPWRPYREGAPRWTDGPSGSGALAGWRARELVAGGLPLLLRAGIDAPTEDIALRAFLGQPLILYGHHDMLQEGPDVLADAAAAVNAVGDVRWCSLAQLARAGIQTRRRGERLDVRMLARRTMLPLPTGIGELHIDTGALELGPGGSVRAVLSGANGSQTVLRDLGAQASASIASGDASSAEIVLSAATKPPATAGPRRRVRTVARRLANEGRDRLRAISLTVPRRAG